jgi:serine protease DegS
MRNGKELKLTAEVGLRPQQEQPPQQEVNALL